MRLNDPDKLRNQFFSAVTGRRQADVSGGANLRGMLMAAYGPSKRDGTKPDTAAAAKSLGVSQRTVQRWLAAAGHQHTKPKAATLAKLARRARQASTTKAGRKRALNQAFGKDLPPSLRFTVKGVQGPVTSSEDSDRPRTNNFDLDDPSLSTEFLNAWVDGGEKGALDWIASNTDQFYQVDAWHFTSVDDLDVSGEYGSDLW